MVEDIEQGTSATEATASPVDADTPVTLDVSTAGTPETVAAPSAPEKTAPDATATPVTPEAELSVAGPAGQPEVATSSSRKTGPRRKKDASLTASPAASVDAVPLVDAIPAPAEAPVRRRATPAKTKPTARPLAGKPALRPGRPAVKESKPAEPVVAKPIQALPAPEAAAPKPRALPARGSTPTTPAAAPPARKATASTKELSIMTATTEFTEKFQSAFKEASEKAKAAFEKSQASFGDLGDFAKGNVEALVESTKILSTGLQELGKGYVSEGKSTFETLTAELKDLATAKSPTEFFEKQSSLMRKHFDAAVAASSKNSEAVLKLANEAFQPISNRVSLAVEKIKQAA